MKRLLGLCIISVTFIMGCATLSDPSPEDVPLEGNATWYHTESYRLSAAHAALPLGTRVRVTNLQNERQVIVTVTARIPPDVNRIINIAQEAAKNIRMNPDGPTPVRLEVLRGRRAFPPDAADPDSSTLLDTPSPYQL